MLTDIVVVVVQSHIYTCTSLRFLGAPDLIYGNSVWSKVMPLHLAVALRSTRIRAR